MKDEIKEKVRILKASKMFSSNIDNAKYIEKQNILLALTGKKPVSEATTCTWSTTPTNRHAEPADHKEVEKFLTELGLYCYVYDYQNATNVAVSLDNDLIKKYIKCNGSGSYVDVGDLFGYPKTATEAYGNQDLMMSIDEQEKVEKGSYLPSFMPCFRFSKAHYKEELEVLKDWHETLKLYNLV